MFPFYMYGTLMSESLDNAGNTPQSLFTKSHQALRKGEKWMKTTATSCSVVATLVTTVTFAAVCIYGAGG